MCGDILGVYIAGCGDPKHSTKQVPEEVTGGLNKGEMLSTRGRELKCFHVDRLS